MNKENKLSYEDFCGTNCRRLYFVDWRGVSREILRIDCNGKSDDDIRAEAFKKMHEFCEERNFTIYYTRSWNADGMTIYDVGSHTEFFHLVPELEWKGRKDAGTENNCNQ